MNNKKLNKKIFFGGTIITMDDDNPRVEAVGISDEKIISVGNLEEVKNNMEVPYTLVDLKGNTLLPGFIDSHMHPILLTYYSLHLNLSTVTSLKELQKILRDNAKNKSKNEFILGFKLNEEQFDNPLLPTRYDLDEACPDHPVFILRYDEHIGIANSLTLNKANINKKMKNPMGGEIQKNEEGELTGILTEKALNLIFSILPFPDPKEILEAAETAFKSLAEKGITSIHAILQLDKGDDLGVVEVPFYKAIQNKILQNSYAFLTTKNPEKLLKAKCSSLDGGSKDSKFKVGGLKLFLDGSFGAKTACMYEPFSDAPNTCGFCVIDEDEIYQKMKVAHNNNFQIIIHAIGDKANRIVMNLYKELLNEFPREDHRHRIEHASILTKDVIKDMKKYGIIASCQPPFINSEYTWLEKRIGKERCKYTYPMKSLVDAGIIIAAGSDCPVEDPSPILGLHALVTRNCFVPEECISMEDALKAYTINGAYAAFEEKVKGSIEVGKLADFVILNKNPLEINNDEIKHIQVFETIIRGKIIYRKNLNQFSFFLK
jgi:predicted amidohydrolase YtcJ